MISDIAFIVGLTALAGICIPVGGLLARVERIGPNWLEQEFRHFLIALGGGILLGAVTIVLIPEGQSSIEVRFGPYRLLLLVVCCFSGLSECWVFITTNRRN